MNTDLYFFSMTLGTDHILLRAEKLATLSINHECK